MSLAGLVLGPDRRARHVLVDGRPSGGRVVVGELRRWMVGIGSPVRLTS